MSERVTSGTGHLVFSSGRCWFGVPAPQVLEVAVWETLTRVPGAPAHMLGVFPIRGEMFPVVDPGVLLGQARETSHRVVALRLGRGTLALTAGQLGGMSEVATLPEPADDRPLSACFRGPVALQNHPEVRLIETDALFAYLSRET
ncbi:MAG TPA: chemotaxis protein CheW [Myxococcaceae bacterium]|nr:chemotaxis protein CheW [Myxococcaceae bacterium]